MFRRFFGRCHWWNDGRDRFRVVESTDESCGSSLFGTEIGKVGMMASVGLSWWKLRLIIVCFVLGLNNMMPAL